MIRMNILLVCPYFFPAISFGGVTASSLNLSTELVKRGHSVTVFTSNAASPNSTLSIPKFTEVDGVDVYYFRNLLSKSIGGVFVTPELIHKSKEKIQDYDIIHLQEFRTFQNIVSTWYARKYNVPYVLQPHGSIPRFVKKEKLKAFYDRLFGYRLLDDASSVIAFNCEEDEQLQDLGVSNEKIEVIHNGIDL